MVLKSKQQQIAVHCIIENNKKRENLFLKTKTMKKYYLL